MRKLIEDRHELLDAFAHKEMDHLKDKRILIIDDSDDSINLMETLIKANTRDIQVRSFKDEYEALKEISHNEYDLIILDVMLNTTDGIKIGKAIKELNIYQGPILFTSANQKYKDEINTIFKKNMNFLPKPIDKALLISNLKKLL